MAIWGSWAKSKRASYDGKARDAAGKAVCVNVVDVVRQFAKGGREAYRRRHRPALDTRNR